MPRTVGTTRGHLFGQSFWVEVGSIIFFDTNLQAQDDENQNAETMEVDEEEIESKPAPASSANRSSRSLLATTATVPDYLLQKYEIPIGCYVTRTVHVDSTLPLFQGRLPPGKIYESKPLASNVKQFPWFARVVL